MPEALDANVYQRHRVARGVVALIGLTPAAAIWSHSITSRRLDLILLAAALSPLFLIMIIGGPSERVIVDADGVEARNLMGWRRRWSWDDIRSIEVVQEVYVYPVLTLANGRRRSLYELAVWAGLPNRTSDAAADIQNHIVQHHLRRLSAHGDDSDDLD